METFVRGGSLEAILDANGDAVAAFEIVDQFQPAMTKDVYLAVQPGLFKKSTLRMRERSNRRGSDRSGLAFEIDPVAHRERNRAWGRRAIPDRRRDDTPDGRRRQMPAAADRRYRV
jgi:hypothetical protein